MAFFVTAQANHNSLRTLSMPCVRGQFVWTVLITIQNRAISPLCSPVLRSGRRNHHSTKSWILVPIIGMRKGKRQTRKVNTKMCDAHGKSDSTWVCPPNHRINSKHHLWNLSVFIFIFGREFINKVTRWTPPPSNISISILEWQPHIFRRKKPKPTKE